MEEDRAELGTLESPTDVAREEQQGRKVVHLYNPRVVTKFRKSHIPFPFIKTVTVSAKKVSGPTSPYATADDWVEEALRLGFSVGSPYILPLGTTIVFFEDARDRIMDLRWSFGNDAEVRIVAVGEVSQICLVLPAERDAEKTFQTIAKILQLDLEKKDSEEEERKCGRVDIDFVFKEKEKVSLRYILTEPRLIQSLNGVLRRFKVTALIRGRLTGIGKVNGQILGGCNLRGFSTMMIPEDDWQFLLETLTPLAIQVETGIPELIGASSYRRAVRRSGGRQERSRRIRNLEMLDAIE